MPTELLPLLAVYGGPLSGLQVPEEDPEIVRAAQSHGFRYRKAVVDGEWAWVYEGLVRGRGRPRARPPVVPYAAGRRRLWVAYCR